MAAASTLVNVVFFSTAMDVSLSVSLYITKPLPGAASRDADGMIVPVLSRAQGRPCAGSFAFGDAR
jgi:hypothetical protein